MMRLSSGNLEASAMAIRIMAIQSGVVVTLNMASAMAGRRISGSGASNGGRPDAVRG